MVHPRQRDGLAVIASPVGTFSAAFYLAKTILIFQDVLCDTDKRSTQIHVVSGSPALPKSPSHMIVEDEGHALVDSSNAAAAKKTRCRQRASDAWVVLPRRTKFIIVFLSGR